MFVRLTLAIVIAGAIAAWMWSGTFVVSGSAEESEIRPPAERSEADTTLFQVRVLKLDAEERKQTLVMRGRTRANATVEVAAETTGRVEERPVERGSVVAKGDILCRLDPGVRDTELAKAEAEAAKAKLDFDAATKLQGRGFESQTRVAATRASLDSANASVAAAEQEKERANIRAPFDGVVEDPLTDEGSVLGVGQLCATVVDADPIVVTGQVTERDIARIERGATAAVALVTGESVTGEISFISRTADENTRTFTVEIRIPNADLSLRAGVTAEAEIPLPGVRAHRLSPGVLTLSDSGALGVRTVDGDGIVSFMPVKIAGQDNDGFWVTGLPDKIDVITVGQDYVINGQKVDPVYAEQRLGDGA
ncbi:efflux RND transporter periplasmic adaptor subunit [Acuticoccus sp. MNP-M23]|uniref:efflux RND transporter periplasmic adaptor subunit n=1 Tax=Acuticoccus sp. MNP-M23 TaxID=3072793 RepID=UPI0028159481|nr:efflux RND transporter periplasmic adaptor subunit [Acuticoccus sp. MNP-M23]WMS42319.1 efflux RND transporter periplasmic adaptor subunit [Acuticoccus sp. MNP-M23]